MMELTPIVLCACGCGNPLIPDKRGRKRRYRKGHHGVWHPSKEWIENAKHNFDNLPLEVRERISRTAKVRFKGTHGFGRNAMDSPIHTSIKHWIIRDPSGRIFEFDNLCSWARQHTNLFLPDDRPESKLPLWRRFVLGIRGLCGNKAKIAGSWRGWTFVSVLERREKLAPDLLRRGAITETRKPNNDTETAVPEG